jgi:apolipoprotein D and lipocalin family protein
MSGHDNPIHQPDTTADMTMHWKFSTMKIPLLIFSLNIGHVVSLPAQDSGSNELLAAPSVDLNRYAGTWYEIARLPNRFQSTCAGDVTATYMLLDDGTIKVVNRCRQENGEFTSAAGIARRAQEDGPNTKLEVRFAPAFLSFLPFVWGDYWIIDLAADYSYAVVGEPGREYLWVLARSPLLDDKTLDGILERTKEQGYDTTQLVRTKHTQ